MSRSQKRFGTAIRLAASLVLAVMIAAPVWATRSASAQQQLPEIAGAVPESAVIFHWMDLDRDGPQWQQTEELISRVGFSDALDLWEEAVLEDGEQSGGITSAELDALLGGEMAFAVLPTAVEHVAAMAMAGVESDTLFRSADATPMAGNGVQPHGIVAILMPSGLDAAWEYVERQFADAAAEMEAEVEERSIGGAEVLALPKGARAPHSGMNDRDQDGMDYVMGGHGLDGLGGIAAARAGEYIVVGMNEGDLQAVIEVIEGSAAPLTDSSEAQAAVAELPTEALTLTYIDGQGVLDVLDPEMIAMLQSAMLETPVEVLASQTAMTVSADDPGFRIDSAMVLNDTVDLDAYTVENDPAVASAAEQAPAGTFLFQAGRIPENAFDGSAYSLAQIVNAAEAGGSWPAEETGGMTFPTEEEMAEEIATASATLGFDLQTELFDLLGGEFVAFSSFPAITFESFGIDAVVAFTTSDPAALAESTEKIAAWIGRSDFGVDINARQVDGDPVYVATSDEMADLPGLEFGVVDERVVFGLGAGIETLTTEPATSLATDEQFQEVMGLLPDAYYQVTYVDIGQAVDPLITLMGLFTQFSEGQSPAAATPVVDAEGLRNLRAIGAVSFQEGNVSGSSAILYIGG